MSEGVSAVSLSFRGVCPTFCLLPPGGGGGAIDFNRDIFTLSSLDFFTKDSEKFRWFSLKMPTFESCRAVLLRGLDARSYFRE